MRFPLGLFLLASLLATTAGAQTPPVEFLTVEFLGTRFEKKFEGGNPKDNSRFIEFGLPPEPIKQWTRLVTYRHFPKMQPDAAKAAHALGRTVLARDKGARHAVIGNEKTGEAIIDFLTVVKDDQMEFNVFKYTPVPGGGLTAMQYAIRFRLGEITSEQLRDIRGAAVNAMAKFDAKKAFAYFGLK